jgi:hypothetical protein
VVFRGAGDRVRVMAADYTHFINSTGALRGLQGRHH